MDVRLPFPWSLSLSSSKDTFRLGPHGFWPSSGPYFCHVSKDFCKVRKVSDPNLQSHVQFPFFSPKNPSSTVFKVEGRLLEGKVRLLSFCWRSRSGSFCKSFSVDSVRSLVESFQWQEEREGDDTIVIDVLVGTKDYLNYFYTYCQKKTSGRVLHLLRNLTPLQSVTWSDQPLIQFKLNVFI